MERAGVEGATPYALRHSFASLLLHEGRSVIYVARQLGHDARLTLGTYGHVINELDEAPQIAAEDAIRAARDTRCSIGVSRRRVETGAGGSETRNAPGAGPSGAVGDPGFEPGTSSLSEKRSNRLS